MLGTPIGDSDFCNEHVRSTAVAEAKKLWEALEVVTDTHVRYTLLRHCASAGLINHLLRKCWKVGPGNVAGEGTGTFNGPVECRLRKSERVKGSLMSCCTRKRDLLPVATFRGMSSVQQVLTARLASGGSV